MKIVITGNMGYVGPAVVAHLRETLPDSLLVGVDSGLFAHCLTGAALPERLLDVQIFSDVRDLDVSFFDGVDAVVHLAAVSNDPMGSRFEAVTDEINHKATVRTAELAARAGVRSFVFASSCSIYGSAGGGQRREADALAPLTAYARSKVAAEHGLAGLAGTTGMTITALRFATACGFSARTRLDLVLNDFVSAALRTRKISVLSDGTPWRPLIHVSDMARAIEWAIQRNAGGGFLAVNAGSDQWNYQVRGLAEAVAAAIPGTAIAINHDAPADKRSYSVDFRLFQELAPHHQPQMTLVNAINDLQNGLRRAHIDQSHVDVADFVRLVVLSDAIDAGWVFPDLRVPRARAAVPLLEREVA